MFKYYLTGFLACIADSLLITTVATLVCVAFVVAAAVQPLYYLLTGRDLIPIIPPNYVPK